MCQDMLLLSSLFVFLPRWSLRILPHWNDCVNHLISLVAIGEIPDGRLDFLICYTVVFVLHALDVS